MTTSLANLNVDPDTLKSAAEYIFSNLDAFENIPGYYEQLSKVRNQLESIIKVCHHLKEDAYLERRGERPSLTWATSEDRDSLQRFRQNIKTIIGRCYHQTLQPLREILRNKSSAYAYPPDHRVSRVSSKELIWYSDIALALQSQVQTLELLLDATNYVFARQQPNPSGQSSKSTIQMAGKLQNLIMNMKSRLNAEYAQCAPEDVQMMLQTLESIEAFGHPWPSISKNQHFRIGRSGSNTYTGRLQELQAIRNGFRASSTATQRRFIIQGAPGSGKTELALKLAFDDRECYWGVFWVDASSYKNAKESFKRIAEIEGTASNHFLAAKDWLSTRADIFEWLLIIDNADMDEKWVEELFPPGHRGCVLMTTRNPAQLKHGTVGHIRLKGMEQDEANNLLLRSAQIAQPWTSTLVNTATSICEYLSFLPLALVQAGKAIVQELCDLAGYIEFVEKTIKRIRRDWDRLQRHNNSHTLQLPRDALAEDEGAESIFGTYEVLYESLEGAAIGRRNNRNPRKVQSCKDALQILQTFSYLHFQNIRLDMLVCAAVNPIRDLEEGAILQQKEEELVKQLGLKTQRSWKDIVQDIARNLLSRVDLPPVLPEALKNIDSLDAQDLEDAVFHRLSLALKELEARGLITRSNRGESIRRLAYEARYHMHPMVHKWVRERPRLTAAEDGLFCQFARTVLSNAVRLQGVHGEAEQAMRRELKPHVDHVRQREAIIRQRIQQNQRRNRSIWSSLTLFPQAARPIFGKLQALEYAKFSIVYMESGEFAVAETLLRDVYGFIVSRVGHDHELTHRVQLFLSISLTYQTRHNEAEELKRQVYESRKKTLGLQHPRTLEIMRELGASVLSQGRLTESLELCEMARDGAVKAYGAYHKETLLCISQIGKVHYFKLNLEESLKHHETAFRRAEMLDSEEALPELDFLIMKEDFAMASIHVRKTKADLEQAEKLQREVVQRRSKLLGEAQPLTLFAKANHGRALAALKRFDEAVTLMSETLVLAQRSLGDEHLGVLAGKVWFGMILMDKGDLDRAEEYLRQATNKQSYQVASGRDGEYQDRIMAVWTLAKCLEKQGKFEEALSLYKELKTTIPLVGGQGLGSKHKLFSEVTEKTNFLEETIIKQSRG